MIDTEAVERTHQEAITLVRSGMLWSDLPKLSGYLTTLGNAGRDDLADAVKQEFEMRQAPGQWPDPGEVLDEVRSSLTVARSQIRGYRQDAERTSHGGVITLVREIEGELEGLMERIDRLKWIVGNR